MIDFTTEQLAALHKYVNDSKIICKNSKVSFNVAHKKLMHEYDQCVEISTLSDADNYVIDFFSMRYNLCHKFD